MCVDFGCSDIALPEYLLHYSDIPPDLNNPVAKS